MPKRVLLASVAIAGCLAGCATSNTAPPMAGDGQCSAETSQSLIGQVASQALAATAMQGSGASTLRWIPPNTVVTMDYRTDRLNIEYDEDSVVTAIRCG